MDGGYMGNLFLTHGSLISAVLHVPTYELIFSLFLLEIHD